MRQVLVDAARRRQTRKWGGGGDLFVTFDGAAEETMPVGEQLIMLDSVLDQLARMNARQAATVESRFFWRAGDGAHR